MRIGLHLPQWGADATRAGVLEVARAAEAAGLDSLWAADHIVHPLGSASAYPYRGDGLPFSAEDGFLEAFTTLAAVAGATTRIRLGTSVFVLPMRDPVLTAKVTATLDVLSSGRLELGVGAGWWAEEFAAVSAPFAGRGERLDEQIDIVRLLWSGHPVRHAGAAFAFDEVVCRPAPHQRPGPPILVGGMGDRALRRAIERGDGWHGVGGDPDVLKKGREKLDRLCEEAGRDPRTVRLSTSTGLGEDTERLLRRLESLRGAGVGLAVLNVRQNTVPATLAALDRLAADVLPKLW
ncbi:TIGR03619 family F420-dependent LLM class oxidoreductase [Amycolatopsis sp. Poz14]|uniref:TIGR03619 family F420-dependent LLM class oxidoreductase n=1 Tax=Amycolatopsis sp. Poz14 TaxID=1447705 RepID=UPI001EE841C7|nr:TIGR03619 family F420-dependent LLM class oxidoreductase [Amycolatopsis sp. Poz14]MCG3753952.1 TIGR03619 family F420-dependent LLM class oxidoreductase [Amycolatopsis sp. Poz14]